MKKFLTITMVLLLLLSSQGLQVTASSAGDDEDPSSGSGGGSGGGGGSPQFYDYYVPLVYDNTSVHGQSEIVVWLATPAAVITTFDQNAFGSNVGQFREPTKLVFNPSDNLGLTNGSLIRTTAPAQVIGQRATEDTYLDQSFAYSILPRRMMGFEYYSPFDGTITLFSLTPNTEIRVTDLDGTFTSSTIEVGGDTVSLSVEAGSYINSSHPTLGVFYTNNEGMSASMAVPRYLQGSVYFFDGDLTASRENEISRSYFQVNPSEPTPLRINYRNGTVSDTNIFGITKFQLSNDIVGVSAERGKIEVNIRIKTSYGGNSRVSTIQLMSIEEMRSAEVFLTPIGYSTHFSVGRSVTEYNFSRYNTQTQSFESQTRFNQEVFSRNTISIASTSDSQILMANDYMFGFSVSPGRASHPMAPSIAFVNLPFNTQTQRNVTGLSGSWYRFANLAVMRVDIVPGPLEEYTGQLIQIEIKANGTLPASQFSVEIEIDEEIVVEETYDFLQVNESIIYNIRKFIPVAKENLDISIDVDIDDEVSEVNEEDNFLELTLQVQSNIRLRATILLIFLGVLGFAGYKFRHWLKQRRTVNRAHVDAILTFEEEEI